MTDTTNSNTSSEAAKPKVKKPKGPIRTGAVAPFLIFFALVWAYFFFFFDTHLRHGLEYVATNGNGAEVDIARVHTSFWSASLEIDKIEVTDALVPTKNKIQIGQVRWTMLWDALLRGKVAIEEASILDVAIGAPRARPGRVLPPPPPAGESAFDKVRKTALDQAQKEFSNNVLGDAAGILNGSDPAAALKSLERSLKSEARVKELQADFAKKQEVWKDRLAHLPQAKDMDDLQKRIKAVKLDGFSNPAEVQKSVQELDAILKDADAKYKTIQEATNAVGSDVNQTQASIKELDTLVHNDIKDLENHLKLPKLDVASLSRTLFGPMFLSKVQQAESYMAKARQYMPPKKTAEEKAEFAKPKPHEREKGRNYAFGRPRAYPLFWLKKAELSSKATKGADWSGNLVGTLTDVTNDPPTLGLPTIASFKGDFPSQEFFGIDGKVTLDHTTDDAVDSLVMKVASFPVIGQKLVDSEEVKVGFDKAIGQSDFTAELRGQNVKITLSSLFQRGKSGEPSSAQKDSPKASPEKGTATSGATPIGFLTAQAKQPILNDIMNAAFRDIPKVSLNANVQGPWSGLQFDIDSNLGRDLAAAFDKQIKMKIDEARAKVEKMVNERINVEREKLMNEFNKAKAQIDQTIKSKQAEVDKAKGQIEKAKNDAVNSQKSKIESEGKKALDDLKNKFHF